jgi:hypothetical protein
MHIKYVDRTGFYQKTYHLDCSDPANDSERVRVIRELVAHGAKFPGNCAGWRVEGVEWDPMPDTTTCYVGIRRVYGIIRVTSCGIPDAFGERGREHSTPIYVFA